MKLGASSGLKRNANMLRRSIRVSWRLRPWSVCGYAIGAALEIASTLITIYATAQLGNLLARYVAGKPTNRIWFWLAVDVAATVGIGIGFWLMGFTRRFIYFSTVRWSVNTYMRKLCYLDYPDLYEEHVRNLVNKVEQGASWQMATLSGQALELCYGIVRFLAITVVVAQITWWIVPLIALFLLPSLLAEAKQAQLVWFVWDQKGDQRHVFFGLMWIFRQAREQLEIRSSQAREYLITKIERLNQTFYTTQEHEYRQASKRVVLAKILESGGIAIGSVVLIKRFLNGTIGFDRYLFLSGALLRVGGALNAVFGTITNLQEPLLYAETFFELVDHPIKDIDQPNAFSFSTKEPPAITFQDMSFTYPGSKHAILDNLSLEIKAGEHIAIVGENGAGKSTLIKLLLRFYKPTSGSVIIDTHDLQTVAIESWYSRLATLFQSFNEYPFSVKENINLGTDSKNQHRLERAAAFGGVNDIVKHLPHSFDTVLNSAFQDGVEPSGGQYQRIALARAFYRDAALLILDEPTAAIDAKAEYDIFNNIFDHYKDKTVIIVSHRFSTVRRADRIIVLDKGKVAEQGSHTQLMKQKGLYHDMFTKQAEGYR